MGFIYPVWFEHSLCFNVWSRNNHNPISKHNVCCYTSHWVWNLSLLSLEQGTISVRRVYFCKSMLSFHWLNSVWLPALTELSELPLNLANPFPRILAKIPLALTMAPSLPQFSAARLRSYTFRIPLFTRCIILAITLLWVASIQSVWDVQQWGALIPEEIGLSSSQYPCCRAPNRLLSSRAHTSYSSVQNEYFSAGTCRVFPRVPEYLGFDALVGTIRGRAWNSHNFGSVHGAYVTFHPIRKILHHWRNADRKNSSLYHSGAALHIHWKGGLSYEHDDPRS